MLLQNPIIVFSHLRWDFVWQRPQHVLSRLARKHGRPVVFIEEPVPEPGNILYWEKRRPEPEVLVCVPHTPESEPGFSEPQRPALRKLLHSLLEEEKAAPYDAWFYTPMAVRLLGEIDPSVVVYDAMDELSGFKFAPPDIAACEEQLLRAADLVFTGGPSLYRARKDRHWNVHLFPSSVDLAHFGRARQAMPDPHQSIPHLRLGFFGVIDERMDLALIQTLAAAHPEWHIVMVGPVVKVDPADLPTRANIHWLGQKPYADLPAYLANWDVCLLPFALNDATRFISPTKTLEYMAGGKIIVSTPITDVAEPYGGIVEIAADSTEFTAACEKALAMPAPEKAERIRAMEQVLARTSWERTVSAMDELMRSAAAKKAASRMAPRLHTEHHPVVIAGAGPTGLSAAYHLGADALLLEKESTVGGWCRSIETDGFTFDYAGHIMFSAEEYVHHMYKILLGDNVHWQDREAWIFSKGVYTRYPFQGALYGLPPEVIKECLVGAIKAQLGPLKARSSGAKAKPNGKAACRPANVKDCCADGILEAEAPLGELSLHGHGHSEPRNFEEFIYRVWGAGIAKHFAIPYNRKLWCVPLSEMETSWLGGRVPVPDLEEMIEGALKPVPKPMGPNARFGYPLRGGFQALMDGFLPHLKGELRLNTRVVALSPRRRTIKLADGREIAYEQFISTMPLPVLVRLAGDEAPVVIRAAAESLRHVSIRCVHLGIGRPKLTEKHWIYFPENTLFHRVFVQGNASPHCNPPGGFGLTCEISYAPSKPLPAEGDDLVQRCLDDCRKTRLVGPNDPLWASAQVDLPYAYVVYDKKRAAGVEAIRTWLGQHGILLAGRYSEWEYYNSDHAFMAGKKAAEQVRELQGQREKFAFRHAGFENQRLAS